MAMRSASKSSDVSSRFTYGAVSFANSSAEKTVLPTTLISRTNTRIIPRLGLAGGSTDGGGSMRLGGGGGGGTPSGKGGGGDGNGNGTGGGTWAHANPDKNRSTCRTSHARSTISKDARPTRFAFCRCSGVICLILIAYILRPKIQQRNSARP